MEANIRKIGAELVEYSSSTAPFTARGAVTELFPYIYEAARRMSTRAISRWLASEQGIKVSAVTIAKALREPQKHWIAYAEVLEPSVRIFEQGTQTSPETFLRDSVLFHHLAEQPPYLSGDTNHRLVDSIYEFQDAAGTIRERWFSIPESSREECIHFLLTDESSTKDNP